MSMTVRVRNMGRLQFKVKSLPVKTRRGVVRAMRSLAVPIEEDIRKSIRSGAKTGKVVKRYRPERIVQTSAPGQAPADDLGLLANSVEVDVDPVQFNLNVGAGAIYAAPLELGSRRMLPRPFLRPAVRRWRKRIVDTIKAAVRGEL